VVGFCKQGNEPEGSKKYRTLTTKYHHILCKVTPPWCYVTNEMNCHVLFS
jgi:hypothetical protein